MSIEELEAFGRDALRYSWLLVLIVLTIVVLVAVVVAVGITLSVIWAANPYVIVTAVLFLGGGTVLAYFDRQGWLEGTVLKELVSDER